MRTRRLHSLAWLIAFCVAALGVCARAQQSHREKTIKTIHAENAKSIVEVVAGRDGSERLGTGFFVKPGLIITNFHVIDGMAHVKIRLSNGAECYADSAKAYDVENDLIALETTCKNESSAALGDSEALQTGQSIVVISNAEGLEQTVSNGLISGIREVGGTKRIQISAPISSGSSGGPVFDMSGRIIAVVVGYLPEGQNLNFAIPIGYATPLLSAKTHYSIAALPSKKKPVSSNEDEYSRAVAQQVLKAYAADYQQQEQSDANEILKQIAAQIGNCDAVYKVQTVYSGGLWFRSQFGPPTRLRFTLEPTGKGYQYLGTVDFTLPNYSTSPYKKRADAERATDFTALHLMGIDISQTVHRHLFLIENGKYQLTKRLYYSRNLQAGTAEWKTEEELDNCWERVGEAWQHLEHP